MLVKRLPTFVAILAALGVFAAPPTTRPTLQPTTAPGEVVRGRLLIKTSQEAASLFASRQSAGSVLPGARFLSRIGKSGWTLWQVSPSVDPRGLAAQVRGRPGVIYAQPVHRVYPTIGTPNDPDYFVTEDRDVMILNFGDDPFTYRRMWHLDMANVEAAWNVWPNAWFSTSSPWTYRALVAVIDTGLDSTHPDYINVGGTSTNVAQGGQIEHSLSAQFVNGAVAPGGTWEDSYGHGTHVAGIALAAGNNGTFAGGGTIGTGFTGRAMALRVFDDLSFGTDAEAAAAMLHAADNGADIINLSLGTPDYSQLLQDATTYCWQKGSLVVAAAGNNGLAQLFYPAASSGALGVGAYHHGFGSPIMSLYSNTGAHVDLAAPGGEYLSLLSADPLLMVNFGMWSTTMQGVSGIETGTPGYPDTLPGHARNYGYLVGTSMATPVVAGVAALYYGKNNLNQQSGWANHRAYVALERSADDFNGLPGGIWSTGSGYGGINAWAALQDQNTRSATDGGAEGRVYFNGTPVSSARVRALGVGHSASYETTTDAYGGFRFQRLVAGAYRITTRVFGVDDEIMRYVEAGADASASDLWVGDNSGDGTPPTIVRFALDGTPTSTGFAVRTWGYDTETSIERITLQLGTAQGASNAMPVTDLLVRGGDRFAFNGLGLVAGRTYWARVAYRNGQGAVATQDLSFTLAGSTPSVTGSVAIQGFTGNLNGLVVPMQMHDMSGNLVQSGNLTLGAGGSFSFQPVLTGTMRLSLKAPFSLRGRRTVTVTAGGATGVGLTLLTGDVDGNNGVTRADLAAVLRILGAVPSSGNWNANADLNGNRKIDLGDAGLVQANMGRIGS